jgi:hypothetical protein
MAERSSEADRRARQTEGLRGHDRDGRDDAAPRGNEDAERGDEDAERPQPQVTRSMSGPASFAGMDYEPLGSHQGSFGGRFEPSARGIGAERETTRERAEALAPDDETTTDLQPDETRSFTMATRNKTPATTEPAENPIDDVLYDWITVLHAKAKAVDAFDQYIADARAEEATECVRLLEKLRAQDVAALGEIREHVAKMFARDAIGTAGTEVKRGKTKAEGRHDVAHRSGFTPTH